MPKTIDYPRTSYLSAWEVAEVVDDTGGKCSIEACARKLNRKVSGSFKAILGSAVKFGLLISKREMLTTTNLFRRIKNAYDKEEEKIYHREAFLHPPLFSHICRKFRNRELPVHMLDVMLVREFDVEEINAQNVAKAFVEGARMVDIIDERNIIADIDQLTKATPRRDLASPGMSVNLFRTDGPQENPALVPPLPVGAGPVISPPPPADDAVADLFGLAPRSPQAPDAHQVVLPAEDIPEQVALVPTPTAPIPAAQHHIPRATASTPIAPTVVPTVPPANSPVLESTYTIRIAGPGLDTQLSVVEEADLLIVQALLEKVRKQLTRGL
ncbi:hypothetical protein [Hymenobacter sp. CRA2]|uniref:hypothetical protein n=1 Tax=Hymenobacter sp. CRA2 TaxID=1955620 RepID=UPI00098F8A15|nr:hypothetical protein [Hymenobacter sp. CRA2]OON67632.1 hypothetical protein B0919_17565 [Hymenobacter sp. CRA2]